MTRLLIIDDDELTLHLYDLLLEDVSDVSFQTAENGTEALELLTNIKKQQAESERWPEFIFIDLHMPDMSGFEFVEFYQQRFQEDQHRARLYFLTSSISQRDLLKTKEYPAVSDILSKPLNAEKLQGLIAESKSI